MFWLRNKNNKFQLGTLIWRQIGLPADVSLKISSYISFCKAAAKFVNVVCCIWWGFYDENLLQIYTRDVLSDFTKRLKNFIDSEIYNVDPNDNSVETI